MTDRILGTRGKKRRLRLALLPTLALLAIGAVALIGASSAPAINTTAGDYSIQQDQGNANDVPGQKDLTLQGTDNSQLGSGLLNILWNWDEVSVSGNNTLDGCALFDTDGDGNANAALCATVANTGPPTSLVLKATTLYTCGDGRNDRCSSTIAAVTKSSPTACQLSFPSATDPFTAGAGYPNDTRVFCTVKLSDVAASSAVLLNTCSYPSAQPNSDPSDCVLIPGKSNPTLGTTTSIIPNDSATLTSAASGGTGATVTFELYKDANTDGICDSTEKVFSEVDSSAPFATSNDGTAYTITTDGTYLWKVIYSGDDKNNGTTQACGTEKIVADLTP